jgi:hypothetical protein
MKSRTDYVRNFRALWPAAFLIFAAACAPVHVRTDYSHATNFSRYKTYSWIKVSAGNGLWADRIQRDVDSQLQSKGWTRVPSGGDAAVTAFGSTRQQPTLETFYDTFGPGFGGWYWGGFGEGMATTQIVNTPIGSLVVDIFDGATKHLVWRGVARQALSGSPEQNKQKLANAVTKMFQSFPPPSRG